MHNNLLYILMIVQKSSCITDGAYACTLTYARIMRIQTLEWIRTASYIDSMYTRWSGLKSQSPCFFM